MRILFNLRIIVFYIESLLLMNEYKKYEYINRFSNKEHNLKDPEYCFEAPVISRPTCN